MEHESDDYTIWNLCSCYSHQKIGTATGGHGNNRTSGVCQNYSIVEICRNTEIIPGDIGRLAVTQTSVGSHPLSLMWIALKEKNNNNLPSHKTTEWKSKKGKERQIDRLCLGCGAPERDGATICLLVRSVSSLYN